MPIIDPRDYERPVLPEAILAAFQGRLYLSLPELAKLLEMDKRTLLATIRNVEGLPWRQKGPSAKKPRRVFTLGDVELIWQQGEKQCQNQRLPASASPDQGRAMNGATVLKLENNRSRARPEQPTAARRKR